MRISDCSSDVCSSVFLLVVQLARNELPCFRGWARLHLYARSDRPAPARRRLHRSRDARLARDDEQEVVMAGFERSNRPLRASFLARTRAFVSAGPLPEDAADPRLEVNGRHEGAQVPHRTAGRARVSIHNPPNGTDMPRDLKGKSEHDRVETN